jgi:hypothetical protein
MPEVSARYLRIAERHSELAEAEATKRGETNQRYPATRTESISIAVTEALKRCASTVVDFDGKLKDWRKNALRDLEAPPHWPRLSGIGYELRTPAAARASCPSRLVPSWFRSTVKTPRSSSLASATARIAFVSTLPISVDAVSTTAGGCPGAAVRRTPRSQCLRFRPTADANHHAFNLHLDASDTSDPSSVCAVHVPGVVATPSLQLRARIALYCCPCSQSVGALVAAA